MQEIIYDGGGHLLHIEHPEETVKSVGTFLDREIGAKAQRATAEPESFAFALASTAPLAHAARVVAVVTLVGMASTITETHVTFQD